MNDANATLETTDLRMPIGPFRPDPDVTPEKLRDWIRVLAGAGTTLRAALDGMDAAALDTPYREGGWTPRQVVHHLADAHMNGFVRFKLALTEDEPHIKTYEEDRWAETADGRLADVGISVALLEALHQRWVILLESLTPEQWARPFHHPQRGAMPLTKAIQLYAWHVLHHSAHIALVRQRT
jgi:hypothetical protein